MKRAFALVAFCCCFSTLALADLGHDVGHGGDYITTENNPWFIGDAPVTYCLDIAPGFSAAPAAVQAAVKNALADWKATLKSLKPSATERALLDGKPKTLSTEFVETACSATTDLSFRFGDLSLAIQDELKRHAQYSVAFAEQTTFSQATGRAQGIIWLVPDTGENRYRGPRQRDEGFWSHSPTLYNVLLHELGHVFGFQHQVGVMSATLPADVVATQSDLLYSSDLYVRQRWTRESARAGRSVCGNVLAASTGILARLVGEPDSVRGWLACLQWDSKATKQLILTLVPQDSGKRMELAIRELDEYRTSSLSEVSGCYRRNDQPEGAFPSCHTFIEAYSDVLLGILRANDGEYSTVVTTNEAGIRLSLIDAAHQSAGWFGIYFNQSFPAPQGR